MRLISILVGSLILISGSAFAKERDYQVKWCEDRSGQLEVILPDRTRIDCETEGEVVEFDFDYKWAEGLGQALHYSRLTGKPGKVVLIGNSNADKIEAIIFKWNLPISVEYINKGLK